MTFVILFMAFSGINCGIFCIQQLDLWCGEGWPSWILCQTSLWLRVCPTHHQLGRILLHFVLYSWKLLISRWPCPSCLPACAVHCAARLAASPRTLRSPYFKTSSTPEQQFCVASCYKIGGAFDWLHIMTDAIATCELLWKVVHFWRLKISNQFVL